MGSRRTRKFHPIPLDIGIANVEGISRSFARIDHVHNHPAGLGLDLHHDHFLYEIPSWSFDKFARHQQGQDVIWNDLVFLHAVEVPHIVTISGITVFHGDAATGNVRVGLYANGGAYPAGYLPDGQALLAESASVAVNGVTRAQNVAFATGNLQLNPGIYWAAFMCGNQTDNYGYAGRNANEISGDHFDYARDYTHVFGAFTDPCPVTTTDSYAMMLYLPVVSIP